MSRNIYQSVFENLRDPTLIVSQSNSFKILDVNKAFDETIMSKDIAVKLSFSSDLLGFQEKTLFLSAVEIMNVNSTKCTTVPNVKTLTVERSTKFPIYRHFDWIVSAISDDGILMLTGKKLSTEMALDQRESELIDYFQKAPIALHWLSGTGHVIWANDTELESLGYSASEYIGHSIAEFCPEEGVALAEVFDRLSRGETIRNAPFKFRSKSGEAKYLTVDSNASYHPDGTFKHTRCFIRDDTDRRIREAIQTATVKQLKASSIAKDRFIKRIFHEIRTPIHVVSQSLMRGGQIELNEMKELAIQTGECLGIIEDLGYATMVEAGTLLLPKPRKLDLDDTLNTIIDHINTSNKLHRNRQAMNIDIVKSFEFPNVIMIDKCFNRVLYNLLCNCQLISKSDQKVRIMFSNQSSSLSDSSNFCCQIDCVANSQFDIVEFHNCCQRYFNSDLETSEGSSSLSESLTRSLNQELSLGWFVAYNIIHNLGGLLECKVQGNDVSFMFRLQVDYPDSGYDESKSCNSTPSVGMSPHAVSIIESKLACRCISGLETNTEQTLVKSQKKRVLIVDDSPICQKVLAKTLSLKGIETDIASNGQEACEKLDHEPCLFDMVLMDLRMPIMDGLTATRICKAKEHLAKVPFIILTAELGDDVREEAMNAKASQFLNKPVNASELHQVISTYMV